MEWSIPVAVFTIPIVLWILSQSHPGVRKALFAFALVLMALGVTALIWAAWEGRAAEEEFARTGNEFELHMRADHAAAGASCAGFVGLGWAGVWLIALLVTRKKRQNTPPPP